MGCSVSKDGVVTRRSTQLSTRPTIHDPGIRKWKVNEILENAKRVHNDLKKLLTQEITEIALNYLLCTIEDQEEKIAQALPLICNEGYTILLQFNHLFTCGEDFFELKQQHNWWLERFNSLTAQQASFVSMKNSLLRSNVSELEDTEKKTPLPASSGKPFACPTVLPLAGSTGLTSNEHQPPDTA